MTELQYVGPNNPNLLTQVMTRELMGQGFAAATHTHNLSDISDFGRTRFNLPVANFGTNISSTGRECSIIRFGNLRIMTLSFGTIRNLSDNIIIKVGGLPAADRPSRGVRFGISGPDSLENVQYIACRIQTNGAIVRDSSSPLSDGPVNCLGQVIYTVGY